MSKYDVGDIIQYQSWSSDIVCTFICTGNYTTIAISCSIILDRHFKDNTIRTDLILTYEYT